MSPSRARTMASHHPYSRASWAMTRWPGAISSQVRGRPVATGSSSLVFADGGLRFDRERNDELAVQGLPDVRHEAAAVAVQPADRQLLGKGGQVFAGRLIDLEVHELGSLGHQVGIGGREPGPLRFVVLVVAEHDQRGGGRGLLGSGLGFGGRSWSWQVSWNAEGARWAPLR